MQVHFRYVRMLVILKPRCTYTCFTCLVDSCSVDDSGLAMCSAVMKLTCLENLLIKRMPFINMMSPASVILLYRSSMVVGRGKISPLMCGVFCLGVFPFRHPRFFPQISSAPLTSSRFSGQFIICTLSSTIFTRCLWLGKAILYCSFCDRRALV